MENNTPNLPEDLTDMDRLFRRMGAEVPHLPYDQLQRYVDNEDMGVRERANTENHLKACSRCRREAQLLRRLHQQPETEWSLAAQGVPVPVPPIAVRMSFWQKALSPTRNTRLGVGLLANAAAIGLIWIGLDKRADYKIGTIQTEATQARSTATEAQTAAQKALQEKEQIAREAETKVQTVEQRAKAAIASATEAAQKQVQATQERAASLQTTNDTLSRELAAARERVATLARQPGVKPATPEEKALVAALTRGKLPDYTLSGSSQDPSKLGGVFRTLGGDFGPVAPARTAVLSLQPTLQWNAFQGAHHYLVQVETLDRKRKTVATPTELTVRLEEDFFKRGETYRWSVTPLDEAGKPMGEAVEAQFQVTSVAVAQQYAEEVVRTALRNIQRGLYQLARQDLEALQEVVPDQVRALKVDSLLGDLKKK